MEFFSLQGICGITWLIYAFTQGIIFSVTYINVLSLQTTLSF